MMASTWPPSRASPVHFNPVHSKRLYGTLSQRDPQIRRPETWFRLTRQTPPPPFTYPIVQRFVCSGEKAWRRTGNQSASSTRWISTRGQLVLATSSKSNLTVRTKTRPELGSIISTLGHLPKRSVAPFSGTLMVRIRHHHQFPTSRLALLLITHNYIKPPAALVCPSPLCLLVSVPVSV